jgi:hypothetical protein
MPPVPPSRPGALHEDREASANEENEKRTPVSKEKRMGARIGQVAPISDGRL